MSRPMSRSTGIVRRARKTAPTPSVSPMVWRRPYLLGDVEVEARGGDAADLDRVDGEVGAARGPRDDRGGSRSSRGRPRRRWSSAPWPRPSRGAPRSMSCRTMVASASSGNVRMSPSRLRVNSTLPAPMKTILVMSSPFRRLSDSVANQAQTSKDGDVGVTGRQNPRVEVGESDDRGNCAGEVQPEPPCLEVCGMPS